MQTEVRLLDSELLSKCEVLWYQMDTGVEAFRIRLVTTTYG